MEANKINWTACATVDAGTHPWPVDASLSDACFVGQSSIRELCPPAVSRGGKDPSRQGLTHTHTYRDPRAASTYSDTHTQTETHTHTHRHRYTHTQRPTHCLNSLELTLHTEHLTDNSHSDFLRDEKCFRATRRLVFDVAKCIRAVNIASKMQCIYTRPSRLSATQFSEKGHLAMSIRARSLQPGCMPSKMNTAESRRCA